MKHSKTVLALLMAAAPGSTLTHAQGAMVQSSMSAEPPGPFADSGVSAARYTQITARPAADCAGLTQLDAGDLKVVSASPVAASADAPAHCRIEATVAPSIAMQINLPDAWNGRFYMFGNGGAAGEGPEDRGRGQIRDRALRQGFVVASTNAGHDNKAEPNFTFAMSNRQKLIDYGYRAVHLTAETAKRAAMSYYAQPVRYSYWDGCSTGGREGLIEAQRFPADFDGLVVGSPPLEFSNMLVGHVFLNQVLDQTKLPMSKVKLVGEAVYAKCDAKDGLQDGLIENPLACDFDPGRDVPTCRAGAATDRCLTPAEVAAFRKLYAGPTSNGKPVYHGRPLGGEPGVPGGAASGWAGGEFVSDMSDPANQQLSNLVMNDPNYSWRSFSLDRDLPKLEVLRKEVDATNPDLSALRKRGGKVLMYYGWADMGALQGVNYYEAAMRANGPATSDFFRLFMVPGMFHCRGGYGPDKFDDVTAVIDWVENGKAPQSLIASQLEKDRVIRSRTLCPYPQTAQYDGKGPPDKAASFVCRTPVQARGHS